MWKTIFADDDGGYTDFYFRNYYRNEETFVSKVQDEVIACCSKHPHEIMLHGRLLRCSMIVGMAVKPNWRGRGIMKEMMQTILDEADHQELITMIQAYQPSLYEQFGFETVYTRRSWTIRRNEIRRTPSSATTTVFAKDCLQLYAQFVSRFNGYILRDLTWYELWMKEIEAEGGRLIGYYENRQLKGYAALYLDGGQLVIRECLYLDSPALYQLVNYALALGPQVILQVSGSENLSRLFVNSQMEESGYTMVRLNNPELFNRLYNCDVKTVREAMMLSGKPLYMHENR